MEAFIEAELAEFARKYTAATLPAPPPEVPKQPLSLDSISNVKPSSGPRVVMLACDPYSGEESESEEESAPPPAHPRQEKKTVPPPPLGPEDNIAPRQPSSEEESEESSEYESSEVESEESSEYESEEEVMGFRPRYAPLNLREYDAMLTRRFMRR